MLLPVHGSLGPDELGNPRQLAVMMDLRIASMEFPLLTLAE